MMPGSPSGIRWCASQRRASIGTPSHFDASKVSSGRISGAVLLLSDVSAALSVYRAGMKLAIERGWLDMHESETYMTLMPAGSELFA